TEFPRFGLPRFAHLLPKPQASWRLPLGGDAARSVEIGAQQFRSLARVEQTSDFHCVATWSCRALRWGGVRFRDFYERILVPAIGPESSARVVIFRCLDGYTVSMLLEDALEPDVLLADTLEGEPLALKHGAPLRLVAPRHYGYKSAKHLQAIEVWRDYRNYRYPTFGFVEHPRARVRYEERARALPGWLLRYPYRLGMLRIMRQFQAGLERHSKDSRR